MYTTLKLLKGKYIRVDLYNHDYPIIGDLHDLFAASDGNCIAAIREKGGAIVYFRDSDVKLVTKF